MAVIRGTAISTGICRLETPRLATLRTWVDSLHPDPSTTDKPPPTHKKPHGQRTFFDQCPIV